MMMPFIIDKRKYSPFKGDPHPLTQIILHTVRSKKAIMFGHTTIVVIVVVFFSLSFSL
jgi:hypothetical protein